MIVLQIINTIVAVQAHAAKDLVPVALDPARPWRGLRGLDFRIFAFRPEGTGIKYSPACGIEVGIHRMDLAYQEDFFLGTRGLDHAQPLGAWPMRMEPDSEHRYDEVG